MSRNLPNLVTALKDAKHFAEIWNAASLWKLDAALNRPVEALWEGVGGMRGPEAGLLRALSTGAGHRTVGAFLRAPGSWELAGEMLTEGQRQRVMEHLRGWVLQSLAIPRMERGWDRARGPAPSTSSRSPRALRGSGIGRGAIR